MRTKCLLTFKLLSFLQAPELQAHPQPIVAAYPLHTITAMCKHTREARMRNVRLHHRSHAQAHVRACAPTHPVPPSTRQPSSSHRCACTHTHTLLVSHTQASQSCSLCRERKLSLEKLVAGSDGDPTLLPSLRCLTDARSPHPYLHALSGSPPGCGCHMPLRWL